MFFPAGSASGARFFFKVEAPWLRSMITAGYDNLLPRKIIGTIFPLPRHFLATITPSFEDAPRIFPMLFKPFDFYRIFKPAGQPALARAGPKVAKSL
jgi:hypothetical protein